MLQALLLAVVLGTAGALLIYRSDHPGEHLVLGASPAPSPIPSGVPSLSPAPAADPCPPTYKKPNEYRPVMNLTFTLSADFSTITGHEQITFVPDREIKEVYLRLWPNASISAANGAKMTLSNSSVQGDAITPIISESGTLAKLPLARPIQGTGLQAVAVTTDFTFVLPKAGNDRYGHQPGLAWWGTGFPLLPYEPRHGWALEPPTSAFAEAATSQDMSISMTINAPNPQVEVVATGVQGSRNGSTWTFTAEAARDVGIAVGTFKKAIGFAATGVPIQAYVADGINDNPSQYVLDQTAAINDHVHRLGPFPYPRLVSVTLPGISGGIEYPGMIFYGVNQHNATPSHEVAHQWFYGLIGDNQARNPWLDESLATFIEALHRGSDYTDRVIPTYGLNKVGAPMSYWEPQTTTYFNSVYIQGALALIKARNTVGPAKFDAALRCYVNSHAHDITTPADFAGAFKDLPQVNAILREVGAYS